MTDLFYPCPCCGYIVFSEPPGSYEICPICFWEDDALQLEFATTLSGGANHLTLFQAQLNFLEFYASEKSLLIHVRKPAPTDFLDSDWRPIDTIRDKFESFTNKQCQRAILDESLYYWRPTFWRNQGNLLRLK
ncbi:CPCC family cysteine-rich protein [Leptospira barantonii]|uniref:Cysteine-rich CPCC domain-containing protein n=1 Tax=Leptospira barantonii TaxID=2023184 RepID=A0ABX4NK83_9LEPT|nr:hypothetical protein CH367_10865 [Leptospira barantonii]